MRYRFNNLTATRVKTGKNKGLTVERLSFIDTWDDITPLVGTRPYIELSMAPFSQHLKDYPFIFESEIGNVLAQS